MKRKGVGREILVLVKSLMDEAENDQRKSLLPHKTVNNVCTPHNIWSEFCADVGTKRLIVLVLAVLGLSLYVAYIVTGVANLDMRIPIEDDVMKFEL